MIWLAPFSRALGREPRIEYIDMPETIRDKYQYFTQADIRQAARHRLRSADNFS